tara:strand:- start:188138 stop:188902 length:765 start_codon:yes stop_codon:yes gene_type:complete
MKKLSILFILSLLISAVLVGCKDDPDDTDDPVDDTMKVRLNLVPSYDGQPLDFQSSYTTQEGYTIEFTKLNFILTEIKNGNTTLTPSMVYKYEDDPSLIWEGDGDYSNFPSLTANVGVGADRNHEDPSALPADDPLNILNTDDMHWGWNTGYIFLMIEGRADTTQGQTGQDIANFLYHAGTDQLLKNVSLNDLNWQPVSNTLYEANLTVDLYKVFDGDTADVDIKNERTSHTMPGQEALSDKIISNFTTSLSTQ